MSTGPSDYNGSSKRTAVNEKQVLKDNSNSKNSKIF
jgi:hypothetical protein